MTRTRIVRSFDSLFTRTLHAYLDKHVLFFGGLHESTLASIAM